MPQPKTIDEILIKYATKHYVITNDNKAGGSKLNDWAGVEHSKSRNKAKQALADLLLALPSLDLTYKPVGENKELGKITSDLANSIIENIRQEIAEALGVSDAPLR